MNIYHLFGQEILIQKLVHRFHLPVVFSEFILTTKSDGLMKKLEFTVLIIKMAIIKSKDILKSVLHLFERRQIRLFLL